MTSRSSTITSLVRKSAPMVALYWEVNFLFTYWFISDVFPTLSEREREREERKRERERKIVFIQCIVITVSRDNAIKSIETIEY